MRNVKMMKSAGVFDTIAGICGGIMRVVGIVLLVFALLVPVFGEKLFAAGSLTLDLEYVKLYLADEYQVVTGTVQSYAVLALLAGSVLSAAVCYAIRQLRLLLAPMKNGRPFESAVPGCLKKIAWTILGGGTIVQGITIAEQILLAKAYPLDEIFSSSAIRSIEYSYTADFGYVFVFCIIMFLSYIFSYGQELQQESDETL